MLVQLWAYTCINWLRTLPYVRAWADRYTDQAGGPILYRFHARDLHLAMAPRSAASTALR